MNVVVNKSGTKGSRGGKKKAVKKVVISQNELGDIVATKAGGEIDQSTELS